MKRSKIYSYIFLTATIILSAACTEIGPTIDFTDVQPLLDTTYVNPTPSAPQGKVVLLEEFTGSTCNNCPAGHVTTSEILADHPDSVIVVAIHNDNPLADPYPGEEDFRTSEGILISQRLGASAAIPTGAIDRMIFPGETQEAVTRNKWKNYVNIALGDVPPVNVVVESDYDEATREVIIMIELEYTQAITTSTSYSIMFTESNIVSPQKLVDLTKDPDYVHDHVLRHMLTPAQGTPVTTTIVPGTVVKKQFKFLVPEKWRADGVEIVDPDHVEIIVFVHNSSTPNDVLQAAKVDLK